MKDDQILLLILPAFLVFFVSPAFAIPENHSGDWYLGESLMKGDYFEYEFTCTTKQEFCGAANMKLWIRDKTQHENYAAWDTVFLVSQNSQKIRYDIELEEYTLFPTSMPDGFHRQGGFYHSLIWLSPITVAEAKHDDYGGDVTTGAEKDILRFGPDLSEKVQLKHDPKKFSDSSWGRYGNWLLGGEITPQGIETISTPAGTFDTVTLKVEQYKKQPKYDSDTTTWIADEFPFPIKSATLILGSDKNNVSSHELQNYIQGMTEDTFYANHAKDFDKLKPPRQQLKMELTLRI